MSADDEKRDARAVDDALLRAFCAVQALCAGAIGVAYPAVVCALATWIFIFTGIVVARELTEKHIPDEARRRRVFGGCWAALWHLWLPCCLLNRWGYFSFHFPSFVYGSGTLLWMLLSFYQRLLGLPAAARASADAVIVLGMFLKPPWSPLGQPAEGLLIACGVLLGELLGFTWAAHQARARNQSKEQAARLLNHAAKRVISNSAQASQLVLDLLDDLTCADEATRLRARDEAEDLLRTQWSSSVIGFHSCRQALLEKALIRSSSRTGLAASWAPGDAERDAFALGDLLARACRPAGAFEVRVDAPDMEIAANRVLLEAILFNALQNARAHGDGRAKIRVGATVAAGQLVVEAENAAGPNHARLLALGTRDLFEADRSQDLRRAGVGTQESTFMGLRDMQLAASAHDPPALLSLTILPASVRFCLRLAVAVSPSPEPEPTAHVSPRTRKAARPRPPRLPEGLCFVVVDDDKIARRLAEKQIAKLKPHARSVVLGASQEETATVPERVCALGADLGVENVVAILDQNMNYVEGDVFGTDLIRQLRGELAWRGVILIQSANCEPSDVRNYLHAGADSALDKGVSVALQTDILARVYHDRFPDRSAGAAPPKRVRRT